MEIQNFTFEVVTECLHTVRINFILYRLKIFSNKNIIGTQAENFVSNLIANNFCKKINDYFQECIYELFLQQNWDTYEVLPHRLKILRDKSWRYVTRCFATFLRGSASYIQLKRWST
jgi:hypothetical protein